LANRDVMIIPLLEEVETLEDIEALVALPGVDVVFLGRAVVMSVG
jgi:2-keto-3-deoxy-L-rhamnonate aldolase RhmA